MKFTAIGWLIWVVAQIMISAIDYYLRTRDGNLITGEFPETLHLVVLIAIGLVSLRYFYIGSAALNIYVRVAVVVLQGVLAVVLMLWLSIMYVCTAGIDCF